MTYWQTHVYLIEVFLFLYDVHKEPTVKAFKAANKKLVTLDLIKKKIQSRGVGITTTDSTNVIFNHVSERMCIATTKTSDN